MERITKILSISLFLLLSGCNVQQSVEDKEFKEKKQNTERLMELQKTQKITFSMDRYLLNERLKRFNKLTKVNYLYLFFPNGTTFEISIIGKLASTSKRLTLPTQFKRGDRGQADGDFLVEAPDAMGVYGKSNGNAKVGMTTFGTLLEFGGFTAFIYSEVPLKFGSIKPIKVEVSMSDKETQELIKKYKVKLKETK